ncbi:MAG TPA: hypothetical protein VFH58_03240 [Acidimicrobiales bacterium]|nr:hypothetical protein [Acidimicrobiales bacterium]
MTADSYVLNGAYQVTACGTATGGTCGSPSTPQDIRVAAPPGDPTHVQARVTGADVGVSWQPPASSPPDLAGYTVARNGRDVYSCSLDGLGPAASVPCPSTLTFADRPGDGRYTYTVSAVRLGADTASRDTVSSAAVAAAGGAVTVSGPAAGSTPGGGGGRTQTGAGSNGGFTPAPIIGSTGAGVGLDSGAVAAQGLPGAAAPEIGAPGSPENLRYPSDDPVVGHAAPLALKVHTPSGRPDVVPLAALALGVLLLAIAAHLLYLRTELEARRAAPRRGGPLSG